MPGRKNCRFKVKKFYTTHKNFAGPSDEKNYAYNRKSVKNNSLSCLGFTKNWLDPIYRGNEPR